MGHKSLVLANARYSRTPHESGFYDHKCQLQFASPWLDAKQK